LAQARGGGRDKRLKRDKGLPPGQAKRLRSGKPLPPGQSKRFDRRPDDDQGIRRAPPRRGGYGRGHILPPESRAARMTDYARYRLRRPPAGYSYYRRGRSAYLVSDRTGMIFEVAPLDR
jgi:Ni/Co efflux regulator RcnB